MEDNIQKKGEMFSHKLNLKFPNLLFQNKLSSLALK